MSSTVVAPANPNITVKAPGRPATGSLPEKDRRQRHRAKISAQVHIRAVNSPEPFQEVCMTVDVSRDGLLFTSNFAGYWKGQRVDIAFPYSSAATAINQGHPADVVRVQKQPGGKNAVAVHFLAAQPAARTERKSVYASSNAAPDERQSVVLAVEPDQRSADSMRSMLTQDGYTVVIVPTAQAALDILRATVPSVFIGEVEAEDMSGQDLCVIIKQNERLRNVPVILLTRSAQPADYSASHRLGAVICMAKPFKPERLQQVVRLVAPPPALHSAYGVRINGPVERTFSWLWKCSFRLRLGGVKNGLSIGQSFWERPFFFSCLFWKESSDGRIAMRSFE